MIVLDTHVWVWYIDSSEALSTEALNKIEQARAKNGIYISCISSWEIYMLHEKKRLAFAVEPDIWISRCEQLSFLNFIPVDNDIARMAVRLPGPLHADPADRMIIATAKYFGGKLITKDEKILNYPHVNAVW